MNERIKYSCISYYFFKFVLIYFTLTITNPKQLLHIKITGTALMCTDEQWADIIGRATPSRNCVFMGHGQGLSMFCSMI